MIKFMNGSDLKVQTLIAVVYGSPNTGKTTLALTADKPALLDFDKGAYRASNKSGKAIAQIVNWDDAEMTKDRLMEFNTIVIDTVGRAIDCLTADIIASNPRHGSGGALTLQGYGVLKSRFKQYLDSLRSYGKDIVLVAHMDEQTKGEEVIERIVAAGSSRNEVYQSADIMGRIYINAQKERILSFNPTLASYAKNVGLEDVVLPDPAESPDTLAKIISSAKDIINLSAEKTQQEHDARKMLLEHIDSLGSDPIKFNALVKSMSEATPDVKKLIVSKGTEAGLEWSSAAKLFVVPPTDEATKATAETEDPF